MFKPHPNNTSFLSFLRQVIHHWITLMSGGIVTVAVAVYEKWSDVNVPKWLYIVVINSFVIWACYLAWQDERKVVVSFGSNERRRRDFIAERLRVLIQEAAECSFGSAKLGTSEGMDKLARWSNHNSRVLAFLRQHCGEEAATRFDKEGTPALEELLSEYYLEE